MKILGSAIFRGKKGTKKSTPGANPTIYNATGSLARLEKQKNI
jgi:hypothetical protein